MLKGISPLLDGELLRILDKMGHGDEIVLADAHFPAFAMNRTVLSARGVSVSSLLDAILAVLPIDTYVADPVVMVDPVPGDSLDAMLVSECRQSLDRHCQRTATITFLERFAFYERSRQAFAVVSTGEIRKYGNILLKKGVTVDP